MKQKTGRPFKNYTDRESKTIGVRVKPQVWMNLESSTAGETTVFLRGVLEKISAAIESGVTPAEVLAGLDNWQTIGGSDDKDTP